MACLRLRIRGCSRTLRRRSCSAQDVVRDRCRRELEAERVPAEVERRSAWCVVHEDSANRLPTRHVAAREWSLGPLSSLGALTALRSTRPGGSSRPTRPSRPWCTSRSLRSTCDRDADDLTLAVALDDGVGLRRNRRRLPAQEVGALREVRLSDVRRRVSERRDAEDRHHERGRGQDDWQSVLQASSLTWTPTPGDCSFEGNSDHRATQEVDPSNEGSGGFRPAPDPSISSLREGYEPVTAQVPLVQ